MPLIPSLTVLMAEVLRHQTRDIRQRMHDHTFTEAEVVAFVDYCQRAARSAPRGEQVFASWSDTTTVLCFDHEGLLVLRREEGDNTVEVATTYVAQDNHALADDLAASNVWRLTARGAFDQWTFIGAKHPAITD
ncbi:MAG: hypothetical protein Q8O67_25770 [Deltaproteobacteria bacterium]|nr:hypothetical protein [Deltaproteobacteria bacterium]